MKYLLQEKRGVCFETVGIIESNGKTLERLNKELENHRPIRRAVASAPYQSNLIAILNLDIPLTPFAIEQARKELHALNELAEAAQVMYSEMGSRLSLAAFDDLSETAKTKFHDALSILKSIRSGRPV